MKTIQITVYDFSELSDSAKERAVHNMKMSYSQYSYAMSKDKIISLIEDCNKKFNYLGDFL